MSTSKKIKNSSKRLRGAYALFNNTSSYSLEEAVGILEKYKTSFASKKYSESVDLSFGILKSFDSNKDSISGSLILPNGLGRAVRVIALVSPDNEQEALNAGAEKAGLDSLMAEIVAGYIDFDVCVATPDIMSKIAKVAKILGPRGLMPSAKNGMLTKDFVKAIHSAKKGISMYKVSKNRCMNFKVGSLSMSHKDIKENLEFALSEIKTNSKGFVSKVSISTTHGPSIVLSGAC
jgi:large subunit ribosomal protein L1